MNRAHPPEPGLLRSFDFPGVRRYSLSNGIPLLVAEIRSHPVVTCGLLLLRAGGTMEEEPRAGIAALTASLLESGAGERGAAEIAETIETLGVQVDTELSWDVAHVGLTALRSRVEPAFPILADLIRRPTFPQPEVDRLRAERLAEIAQRRADPRSLANEMAVRFIFPPESPFARPLGGTPRSVRRLTRQDITAFHATHYSPGAATLLVAGDLAGDEARDLAERHFGDWAGSRVEGPTPPAGPANGTAGIVIVDRPGSVQSEVRVGHIGVPRDTPDYFPLVVLNTILGGAFSSRLNLNLRERHGFTYGVHSGFSMRRQPGPFLVSTAVQSEVTAAAIREIHREIGGIRDAHVSPHELEDARNYLAGVFPLRLQTTDGVASRLAELVIHGLPEDYWDAYRSRILEVSAEEVLRVAREHLHPDRLTTLVVGDAAQLQEPLGPEGFGPVRVIDPAEIEG